MDLQKLSQEVFATAKAHGCHDDPSRIIGICARHIRKDDGYAERIKTKGSPITRRAI